MKFRSRLGRVTRIGKRGTVRDLHLRQRLNEGGECLMCFERDMITYVCESGDETVRILARINDVEIWVSGEEWLDLGQHFDEMEVLDFTVPHEVAIYFDEDGIVLDLPETFPAEWTVKS